MANQNQQSTSRKKFLLWGAATITTLTGLNFFSKKKKEVKTETVKMLAQDGTLVEIDKKLLASSGKKITNEALQNWIKK